MLFLELTCLKIIYEYTFSGEQIWTFHLSLSPRADAVWICLAHPTIAIIAPFWNNIIKFIFVPTISQNV